MFFTRSWFYLLGLLPARGRFSRYVRVVFGYYDCREKIAAWHFAELKKLDPLFALAQEALRISAAYDQAEAAGIGPMDPRYPSFFSSSEIDWKEEVRVHSDVLDRFRKTGGERMRRFDEALKVYPQERVDAVTQACVNALNQEDHSQKDAPKSPAIPGEGFMGEVS